MNGCIIQGHTLEIKKKLEEDKPTLLPMAIAEIRQRFSSFADEIIPIWNDNNNCTSCHNGGQAPDLRAANAYASVNTTRYINSATPEESKIYKYCSPETTTHTRKKYNSAQAALVLAWIQQGAKNN